MAVFRYLGREGWVPQMYLKKLGEEHCKARAARKSVIKKCSALEIRTSIEEEEEMIIGEIAVNEKDNFLHFGVTTILISLGQEVNYSFS